MKRIFVFITVVIIFTWSLSIAEEDPIIARIGKRTITLSEFNRIIGYLDEFKQKAIQENSQLKKNMLKRIVQTQVIADIARKEGFVDRPDVQRQLELVINNFIAMEYLRKVIVEKVRVTEEDIEVYYQSHRDEFTIPEEVRARHILIKVNRSASEEEKREARKKAEELLRRIRSGESFEKLAETYSEDIASKNRGGDLGYFTRGRMVKPFEEVAFSLNPGEVSEIVETEFGYHIIKVEDKKPERIQPLEEVKERIKERLLKDLRQTKIRAFIQKAMKDAGVEMYPERLLDSKEKVQ